MSPQSCGSRWRGDNRRPMFIRLPAITPSPTHRFIPSMPRYRQRASPCRRLRNADWSFASGPPLLSPLEPALLFQFLPFGAARTAIRNRNIFHAQEPGPLLVRLRIKTRIPCNRLRHPTQSALLLGNRRQEQSLIGGAFLKHFVIGDDLVLCFLQLH